MDPEYLSLEFDINPEAGAPEIDSFFEWATHHERQAVRHIDGTEQLRLASESGYQLLMVRPDAEHKSSWVIPEIGRDVLMQTHIVRPDGAWRFSFGEDDAEVELEQLTLSYVENVGNLIALPFDDKEGYFPIPQGTQEEIAAIYSEELYIQPWDTQA